MEIPGALAETGIRNMVLDRTHSLSVFMQMAHSWMLHCGILIASCMPTYHPSKPDISPDQRWRIPMKNLFLAAFAALSLSAAVVPVANAAVFHNGSTVAGDAAATRMQQTGQYAD
jgi:hypothetical protein